MESAQAAAEREARHRGVKGAGRSLLAACRPRRHVRFCRPQGKCGDPFWKVELLLFFSLYFADIASLLLTTDNSSRIMSKSCNRPNTPERCPGFILAFFRIRGVCMHLFAKGAVRRVASAMTALGYVTACGVHGHLSNWPQKSRRWRHEGTARIEHGRVGTWVGQAGSVWAPVWLA